MDALISDSFWYVICRVFKSGLYIHHEEFFLDRLAANYVSFTLHEEFMGETEAMKKPRKSGKMPVGKSGKKLFTKSDNTPLKKLGMKDAFFKHFYNAIAQSVF